MTGSEKNNEQRNAQRQTGRGWAFELQTEFERSGEPFGWFEALYDRAEGDAGYIPWEMAAPRFKLLEWLAERTGSSGGAIDIGCGLGDNARCLAEAGFNVTAFDISQTAVDWARKRNAGREISFAHADLFETPTEWTGAFDLVHETYNLQALPRGKVGDAIRAIASLSAPGGTVLVMTRARDDEETPEGPPWPLAASELEVFETAGLEQLRFEEFYDEREDPIRHFLAEYIKSG